MCVAQPLIEKRWPWWDNKLEQDMAVESDKCSDGGTCGLGGFCTNCHNLP